MQQVQMLVLAKSYKAGGYCIAGPGIVRVNNRAVLTQQWLRPVTVTMDKSDSGAVSAQRCQHIEVLDVVSFRIRRTDTTIGQPENRLLSHHPIQKVCRLRNFNVLHWLHQPEQSIWFDPSTCSDSQLSLRYGVPEHSLMLVIPEQLSLTLEWNGKQHRSAYKICANIRHQGRDFIGLPVTDPVLQDNLAGKFPNQPGKKRCVTLCKEERCALTLSLTPYSEKGYRTLLVAAVMTPNLPIAQAAVAI